MEIKDNKKKIKEVFLQMEKQFGADSIMLLGQKKDLNIKTFSSGSIIIDNLLGIKGYPKGKIIEIFGPESSGKTTLALHAIAEIQKLNGIAAFIDVEHALDPIYAKKLNIDIDNLIFAQPNSGEQALEIVDVLVKSQIVDLIVLDSVAALVPEIELNGEMKDQTLGTQARLMSKALRKITGKLSKSQTTIIFINQVREKIGIIFGNPEVTPGGRALKFFSSIRLETRRISSININNQIKGNNVRVKITKNKLAPPFKVGIIEIIFSEGISKEAEIIDLAEKYKILEKKGSWYKKEEKNLAHGRQKLKEKLSKDKKLFLDLEKEIKNKLENNLF